MADVSPNDFPSTAVRRWVHAMRAHRHGNEVYQTSTMGALLAGAYEGNVTVRELLHHGDFGLGTFNALDGEMLVLDGVCHQLRSDGTATVADPVELSPFAVVTWFRAVSHPRAFRAAAESGMAAAKETFHQWYARTHGRDGQADTVAAEPIAGREEVHHELA